MTTQELTLDSREVARMIGKEHNQLLRVIRGYVKILDDADAAKLQSQKGTEDCAILHSPGYEESAKLRSRDFFILHSYFNSQNKEQPCFLITKKGCDMIANKMTGERGVLFTATYVTRFEEMTKQLQQFNPYAATRQTIGEVAKFLHEIRLISKEGGISLAKSMQSATEYLQAKGEPLSDVIARMLLAKEDSQQARQLTLFDAVDGKGA